MTITELATFQLLHPHTAASPTIRTFLRTLAERQSSWSGSPLFFFQNTTTLSDIYLVSGWKSVEAHGEWIASAGNQELLWMAKGLFIVKELAHVDINFDAMPRDADRVVLDRGEDSSGVGPSGEQRECNTQRRGLIWEEKGRVLDAGAEGVYCIRVVASEDEGPGKREKAVEMRRLDLVVKV